MTGKMYDEGLGKLHFWLTFVAFNATFMPMHWLGLQGMQRRIADYPSQFGTLNFVISIFAFILGASTLVFLYNMAHSWWRGEPAPANPWRALTLEWQVSYRRLIFNFDEPPQIVGSPYAYGVPGARHAIVTVHAPPQPEEVPVPVALAVATREERKAIMSALKHILVVANQTVSGDPLIAAVRSRAAQDPLRVTVICRRTTQPTHGSSTRPRCAPRHRRGSTGCSPRSGGPGSRLPAMSSNATRTRRSWTSSMRIRPPKSWSGRCRRRAPAGCAVT